jgi:hypothetical protein
MVQIKRFSEQESNTWNNFLSSAKNSTIFHHRDFLSYHPKDRFVDHSLLFYNDNEIISVFPSIERKMDGKKILHSHQGASYGSYATTHWLTIRESFDMVTSLISYAKDNEFSQIIITVPPVIYLKTPSNYIDFSLVKNGFTYLKRELTSVVPLEAKGEKLLQSYRAEARTATRKALRSKIVVRETNDYEQYYALLSKNLSSRHNVKPTHTLEEITLLHSRFPDKIRLFGAFLDETMIGGVCNFSVNENVVLAFYISHSMDYQEYRPVNVLFYEIMQQYKTEGFSYLDFGTFTLNMEPNWGLGRFKENFGARGVFRDTFVLNVD